MTAQTTLRIAADGIARLPVAFIPAKIALSEQDAFEFLGLNDGRNLTAKKKALYRFCSAYNIKALPGRTFPVRALENAVLKSCQ